MFLKAGIMIESFSSVHMFAIIFFLAFNNVISTDVEPSCSDIKRHEIEQHLSTKTPYRVVANLDNSPFKYTGCHPTRMWSINRHGTRNPSKEVINDAKNKLRQLRRIILQSKNSSLCQEELNRLNDWDFNITSEEEKFLVPEGEEELIELAERMQQRFPDLLPSHYYPDLYYFKYTATQRTLKSALSFATGLFGRDHIGEIIFPKALHKDPVLRFYKLCNRWQTDVDKNPKTFDNMRKFLDGPEFQDALTFIRQRTQISNEITAFTAKLIYTICAFETAWNRRQPPSVWCNLFNRETIKALEYAEDLEYYWNDGYGYDLTHKIACPAIVDMFKYIDENSNKPNSTFYFTHSGTLLKVLAHLGLYKDVHPLTSDDFKKHRSWRTSAIDAFASNIAFILYKCSDRESMVLTLHQERPIRIPGCPTDHDLCSLNQLRKIFANSLDNCDFHEICNK